MTMHTQFTASDIYTDGDILLAMSNVATVQADHRGFIVQGSPWTPEGRAAGLKLAVAAGVPEAVAATLRDADYLSLYMAARSQAGASGARRLARKLTPTEAPTIPYSAPTGDTGASQAQIAEALAKLAIELQGTTEASFKNWEAALPAMVKGILDTIAPRPVTFTIPNLPPVTVDHAHKALPRVLRKALKRRNVYVYGGVGTGKTTMAQQLAKVLHMPFAMASSVFEEHKLFGYMSAGGVYVGTDFRRIFEFGGVFLFDELDRSDPGVVVAFNAVLGNAMGAFPDGLVMRHPDCVIIAAGNTPLRGQTAKFSAAQRMDASVLERFCVIPVEIDTDMEQAVCINPRWLSYVRALRAATAEQSVDNLEVSPRASIDGAIAIAEGDTWAEAADGHIWKGIDTATRSRLERAVPITDYAPASEELI